jgi:DNA polymerase-3 subunit delta
MIYLYTGENDYAVSEKVRAVCESFRKKYAECSVERIDGEETDAAGVMAKLTGVDMFTPRKLLVLTGMGKRRATWEGLARSLGLVADSTEVVIVEPKPDGRLTATKEIRKAATVTEFKALKAPEVERWARGLAQEMGLEMKGGAVRILAEYCGWGQWEMRHEMEKLRCLGRVMTEEMVRKYVRADLGADVFTVLELAVNGRMAEVNAALEILRVKEDVNKFLGLIGSQIFNLAAVKTAPEGAAVAREVGVAPWLIGGIQRLAGKITEEKLGELTARMAEVDGRVKLGEDGWVLVRAVLNRIFG